MKNTILILISLLFLTGCEKEVTSLQDRGGVKYEINSEVGFTGRLVKKYRNEQKKLEGNYKDGKEEGLWTEWHKNGQKEWEGNYKDGKEDGLFTMWDENGQKKREENWKDGNREGLWTRWDKEGNVTKTETWKDGELVK